MARRTRCDFDTIEDTATSFVFLSAVCVVIAGLQINFKPFGTDIENRFDYFSLSALAVIAIVSLFAVMSQQQSTIAAAVYTADAIAAIVSVLLLLYALYMARGNIVAALRVARARFAGSDKSITTGGLEQQHTLESRLLDEKDEQAAAGVL